MVNDARHDSEHGNRHEHHRPDGSPPRTLLWWQVPVRPGHSLDLGQRLLTATAVWFGALFVVAVIIGALILVG